MRFINPEDPAVINDANAAVTAINAARTSAGQASIPVQEAAEATAVEALTERVRELEKRLEAKGSEEPAA